MDRRAAPSLGARILCPALWQQTGQPTTPLTNTTGTADTTGTIADGVLATHRLDSNARFGPQRTKRQ